MNNMQEQVRQLQEQNKMLTNQVQTLSKDLSNLKAEFYKNNLSGEYVFLQKVTFKNGFAFGDGSNIPLGTTTGTKIGTSTLQKLGFYNKTPITQPMGISAPSGGGTQDTQARAAINSIISALNSLGLTG